MEPSATPAEGYGSIFATVGRSGERGEWGHSDRPQRPLFPCPDIPDKLANIGSDRLSNRHKPPHCQGMENAKTLENIDLSAMSAMSAVKYHSGGKNPT